jgi:hypothetical protein
MTERRPRCTYCRLRPGRRWHGGHCSTTCAHRATGYNRETARLNAERKMRERARDEFIKEIVRADTPEAVAAFNAKYAAG